MVSINRTALVTVKPCAVTAEGNQGTDRRDAILERDVISLHRELSV